MNFSKTYAVVKCPDPDPYAPTEHVVSQLNMVHKAALDINNWHLTMPILALPLAEGGLGQVGLGFYGYTVKPLCRQW